MSTLRLIYTKSLELRAQYPKAFHRDNWQGQITMTAKEVYTDMDIVRRAYESVNIPVFWIGEKETPVKKKRVARKPKAKKDELRDDSGSGRVPSEQPAVVSSDDGSQAEES